MEKHSATIDQNETIPFPKDAIDWMIDFLNSKKSPKENGSTSENRSSTKKPYTGIPTYIVNRNLHANAELFTVMEIKMILKKFDDLGIRTEKHKRKGRMTKANLIQHLKSYFISTETGQKYVPNTDPVWEFLRSSRSKFSNTNDPSSAASTTNVNTSNNATSHTNAMSASISPSSRTIQNQAINMPNPYRPMSTLPSNNTSNVTSTHNSHQQPLPTSYYHSPFPPMYPGSYSYQNIPNSNIPPHVHNQYNAHAFPPANSPIHEPTVTSRSNQSLNRKHPTSSTSNNNSSATMGNNVLFNATSPSSHKKHKVKIKQEVIDFDSHPKTTQERLLLMDLRAMGFTSTRETLGGIRHAIANTPSGASLTDAAMIWIVTQREAAEEAKYLDVARVFSERTREEEAKTEKNDKEKILDNAPTEFILMGTETSTNGIHDNTTSNNEFFPTSVVLKSDKSRSSLRDICANGKEGRKLVIQYLSLEKKALKWYGIGTAYSYFQYDSLSKLSSLNRIEINLEEENGCTGKKTDLDQMMLMLADENNKLERALYSLSEQSMNVPKIFMTAKKNAMAEGLTTDPQSRKKPSCSHSGKKQDEEDIESDEVMVIEVNDDINAANVPKKDAQTCSTMK